MVRRFLFLLLAVAVVGLTPTMGTSGDGPSSKGSQAGPPVDFEEAWASNVAKFARALKAGHLTDEQILVFEQALVMRVDANVYNKTKRRDYLFSPAHRKQAAQEALGSAYAEMETYFVQRLVNSDGKDVTIPMYFLSHGLSSEAGKSNIRKIYDADLAKTADDNRANRPDMNELFGAAEALAYLGDAAGLDVLDSTLSSNKAPATVKVRALNAFAFLPDKAAAIAIAEKLLSSEDARLAYEAYEVIEKLIPKQEERGILYKPSLKQIERIAALSRQRLLKQNEEHLLLAASMNVREGGGANVLTQQEVHVAKQAAKQLLQSSAGGALEQGARLLAEFANDEDVEQIGRMLDSDVPVVRAMGAQAVAKLNRATRQQFLAKLMVMLDDPDGFAKRCALLALRTYRKMRVSTLSPDSEFEEQRIEMKTWYEKTGGRGAQDKEGK